MWNGQIFLSFSMTFAQLDKYYSSCSLVWATSECSWLPMFSSYSSSFALPSSIYQKQRIVICFTLTIVYLNVNITFWPSSSSGTSSSSPIKSHSSPTSFSASANTRSWLSERFSLVPFCWASPVYKQKPSQVKNELENHRHIITSVRSSDSSVLWPFWRSSKARWCERVRQWNSSPFSRGSTRLKYRWQTSQKKASTFLTNSWPTAISSKESPVSASPTTPINVTK